MSIFVQIAAYRDPQLIPTIEDLLSKARRPDELTVAICRQFKKDDTFDNLDYYRKDPRFKIIDVDHKISAGVGWARNSIQQLYSGETYTLQIDSHSRFANNWDDEMITMISSLQDQGIEKPILTGYPASFELEKEQNINMNAPALQMILTHFSPEGIPMCEAETIPDWQTLSAPVLSRFYSAGFCFTLGSFCIDVKHDPEVYFIGEEISIAVRAYTNGYDLFHPNKMLVWHQYIREGMPKQWDDDSAWQAKHQKSIKKIQNLLGINLGQPAIEGEYGLGTKRTLESYEIYAGIDFYKIAIQKDVINKDLPILTDSKTKTKEWYEGLFNYYVLEIEIDWKIKDLVKYILFAVFDLSNNNIYESRIRANEWENNAMISNRKINVKFFASQYPAKWIARFVDKKGAVIQLIKSYTLFNPEGKALFKCNL
ncbi:MAG: hypothetical protein JNK08_05215 [Sediminibacterium sp.]|nr:hypothetical protein [Sediminibacterium sp.]